MFNTQPNGMVVSRQVQKENRERVSVCVCVCVCVRAYLRVCVFGELTKAKLLGFAPTLPSLQV